MDDNQYNPGGSAPADPNQGQPEPVTTPPAEPASEPVVPQPETPVSEPNPAPLEPVSEPQPEVPADNTGGAPVV